MDQTAVLQQAESNVGCVTLTSLKVRNTRCFSDF